MITTAEYLARAQDVLMPVYTLQNVVMDRGAGCYLYDTDGKKYIDCAAGIAVASLGHAHPKMIAAATDQMGKLMTVPASYTTSPRIEAAEILIKNSCMDQVFFCNSGTEAVEAALKLARKWAHDVKGPRCKEIITFGKSFHGRSYGAVSVTEKARTYPEFGPYLPGVHFATFNNIDSVKNLVSPDTCAIIFEPVQGEGGITPIDIEFYKALRSLCDEHNIALIADEVQAGMGRLGTFFAYESFGIEPDIITLAKGIAGGFPVGAMLAKTKFAKHLTPGVHGTTYGGNPLSTHMAATVAGEIAKPEFLAHVKKMGAHFKNKLDQLRRETNCIEDIRGMGLMLGVDTVFNIKKLMKALVENGLVATVAGERTLRLTPPLIITEAEIDEAVAILAKTLRQGDLS